MEKMDLDLSNIRKTFSVDSLCQAISNSQSEITIKVPCPSMGGAWNIDLAYDYLSALFVGEEIAEFCETIRVDFKGPDSVFFTLRTCNEKDLSRKLIWLSSGFDDKLWWDNADFKNVHESIEAFSENMEANPLRFPELGDKYFANYLPGIEQIADEVNLNQIYFRYPERRYGFWRSCISQELGHDLYVSNWAWIILNDPGNEEMLRDVNLSLERYGGFKEGIPPLLDAFYLSMNDLPSVVFNDFTVMHFSLTDIKKTQACAMAIWDRIFREDNLNVQSGNVSKIVRAVQMGLNDEIKLRLSENGYLLVASDAMAQYIFFKTSPPLEFIESHFTEATEWGGETVPEMWKIPQKFQGEYWNVIDKLSETLGASSGNPVDIALDWDQLDGETFEQLCYDILGQVEMFDPDTRRKMGKSQSRDGGRDIIVYSRARLGIPSCKWIVQCKLVKDKHSLSGGRVDVLAPVAQYGADGFCLMTSAIIDSTLFDKLEGVARNLSIQYEQDIWSGLRIERFLARPQHRNIRKRYFKKRKNHNAGS